MESPSTSHSVCEQRGFFFVVGRLGLLKIAVSSTKKIFTTKLPLTTLGTGTNTLTEDHRVCTINNEGALKKRKRVMGVLYPAFVCRRPSSVTGTETGSSVVCPLYNEIPSSRKTLQFGRPPSTLSRRHYWRRRGWRNAGVDPAPVGSKRPGPCVGEEESGRAAGRLQFALQPQPYRQHGGCESGSSRSGPECRYALQEMEKPAPSRARSRWTATSTARA